VSKTTRIKPCLRAQVTSRNPEFAHWLPPNTLTIVIGGNIAFFDPERQIVLSDTHRGNLILMDDGLLAPIDLRMQQFSGSLLDPVTQLCATH